MFGFGLRLKGWFSRPDSSSKSLQPMASRLFRDPLAVLVPVIVTFLLQIFGTLYKTPLLAVKRYFKSPRPPSNGANIY